MVTKRFELPVSGPEARVEQNGLPGTVRAYAMRDGFGEHHLVGGQVATVIARSADTGGLFEAAVLTGGIGATLPAHRHELADTGMLVLDGQIELWFDGRTHLLSRGDYAALPRGTTHAHRMASHRTRLLVFTVGGSATAEMLRALGQPFSRSVPPERTTNTIPPSALAAAEATADVVFERMHDAFGSATPVTASDLPGRQQPYVLRAGEGERLVAGDQIFTFLTTQAETGARFIAVETEGPAGGMIVPHYHAEHTENFLCLDGLMTMVVNGEELRLYPGDYLQVPPGHVHSYRLDAPYTRFFGWLAPGIFEPFFRLIGDPYVPHVFPLEPGSLRFDRVMAHISELDLHIVDDGGGPA